MKNTLLSLAAAASLLACSPPPKPPVTDAGPDTSCGIDCAAQDHYGLRVDRCFEYTHAPGDVLGVQVKELQQLEGGVSVLPIEYRQGGLVRMTDYFMLRDGDLLLARRTFLPGQSVTYKDPDGNIVGVRWLAADSEVNASFTSTVQADVTTGSERKDEATTYNISVAAPTASELNVPYRKFDSGLKVLASESPNHGADPRRVFAAGVGFTLLSTAFSLTGGTPQEYRLVQIRDLGTPDAGTEDCGFGVE